ncbi:MAG TPA: hypothetical protein EYP59_09635, partial [Thiotrichaceae bacterium]|nr:hypothetical protein [Thiotrichaceae bacterium]
ENTPEVLNSDPYGDGWLIRVELSDKSELEELMDASAFSAHSAVKLEDIVISLENSTVPNTSLF